MIVTYLVRLPLQICHLSVKESRRGFGDQDAQTRMAEKKVIFSSCDSCPIILYFCPCILHVGLLYEMPHQIILNSSDLKSLRGSQPLAELLWQSYSADDLLPHPQQPYFPSSSCHTFIFCPSNMRSGNIGSQNRPTSSVNSRTHESIPKTFLSVSGGPFTFIMRHPYPLNLRLFPAGRGVCCHILRGSCRPGARMDATTVFSICLNLRYTKVNTELLIGI